MLKIQNLKKEYDDRLIFDKLNLEIQDNERIGVVGNNGAGKTTLVNIIMSIEEATSGKVLMSIATEKSIASYRSSADIFKFIDLGRENVEIENGYSVNEPVNYAVRAAIEQGVIELVMEGVKRKLWNFKEINLNGDRE